MLKVQNFILDKKKDVYEGCMPIEVLASRGKDTMRYGPLKPVGLINPETGHRPWANLQLRKENVDGTMYNLVGFQTNLKAGTEYTLTVTLIPEEHYGKERESIDEINNWKE